MGDGRYHANRDAYLHHAMVALGNQFASREDLEAFYEALASDEIRDEFLRIASFFRFLVKNGDWYIYDDDGTRVIDYLTETYKVVALFSLIESVGGPPHQDFFQWLMSERRFPIPDSRSLNTLHEEYKDTYGSVRRCLWFFQHLPEKRKIELCASVKEERAPMESIRELARFMYNLRSSFVHQADLVLELSNATVVSRRKGKIYVCDISLNDIVEVFEECLVIAFRAKTGPTSFS